VRLADSRWLTDENIHPEVVTHLRGRGLDVLDMRERGWHGRSDDELLQEAYPFPAKFPFSGVVRSLRETAELRDDTMTGKAIQDLVGRVMIDREFLTQLARDPDVILAGYELTAEERAVIMQALGRGAYVSEEERAHALQNAMLKRWAT
jgi:hypothetical protein